MGLTSKYCTLSKIKYKQPKYIYVYSCDINISDSLFTCLSQEMLVHLVTHPALHTYFKVTRIFLYGLVHVGKFGISQVKIHCKEPAEPTETDIFLPTCQLNACSASSFIHPPLQTFALTFCQRVILQIPNREKRREYNNYTCISNTGGVFKKILAQRSPNIKSDF